MALAVFFLLLGMLFSELAVFGLTWAGMVGAGLLAISALTLLRIAWPTPRHPAGLH